MARARGKPSSGYDEASELLFELGRAIAKLGAEQDSAGRGARLSNIHVTQAVQRITATGEEATVGRIAQRMRVDPSTASRLVTQTLEAHYLRRAVSQTDGRAVVLELTDAGQKLAQGAQAYQRAVFDELTKDWTSTDRKQFAALFARFAQAFLERE